MEFIVLAVALVTCAHLFLNLVEMKLGLRLIKPLANQTPLNAQDLPFLSIIFSALNEEDCVMQSIEALLKLDYPRYEIIAINDRSTDKTPDLLNQLQKNHPNLRVIHIHQLPEGWLGKNHALHLASQQARGEWLLFTDADVLMREDSITKAMSYAIQNRLDHLTIYEDHLRKSFWLKLLMLGSYTTYFMVMKPWRIRFKLSKKSLGHGAFNLVNRAAYDAVGGHKAIAMECLDDLMLGKILKKQGFRQDIINANHLIEREWYASAWSMINGLKKNSFAFFNFNLISVCRDFCFAMLYYIWPIIGVIVLDGPARWLNVVNVGLTLYLISCVAKHFHLHRAFTFLYPISILMLLYTVWHSVFATYFNKGIVWRETHYSLEKLKYKKSAINGE